MSVRFSQNCPIKGAVAFFISPDGMLCQVEGGIHIATVMGNPTKFGVTTDQIVRVYDFFGEKVGVEGIARKQILTHLIQRGWIRLRRYPNKYWSVTVPGLTDRVAEMLQDWANKFVRGFAGFREADLHMPVIVAWPLGKVDRLTITQVAEGALLALDAVEHTGKDGTEISFLESAALLPDVAGPDPSVTALEPRVGIFFLVDGALIVESLHVSGGENDGDFVNDPRSHHDCWRTIAERFENKGGIRLSRKSYDYFPRGRCLYSSNTRRFFLYLDPCIVRLPGMRENLLSKLQIPAERTDVIVDDPHYRCATCNPLYVPDP